MKTLFLFIVGLILATYPVGAYANPIKLEAESAQYTHCEVQSNSLYSGRKALRLTQSDAKIAFSVDLAERGKYTLLVAGQGIGGEKVVNCTINGSTNTFRLNKYAEVEVGTFNLKTGPNSLIITPNWTWFEVDYIRLEPSADALPFNISDRPVDPNATEAACKMYGFLASNFGKKTISGMMTGEMPSSATDVTRHPDIAALHQVSGRYPALIGFDLMNATGKSENDSWFKAYTRSCINLAADTYRRGGFPAFTWHWRDPSHATGEFYTNSTSMKISAAMDAQGQWNTSSALYRQLIHDIDVVASYFLELQDQGVACIFRPLHEASGGWFWWGREGAAPFRQLYHLIYHQLVDVRGVHNLIWVWNAGTDDHDWDPGQEYYDVVSADFYNDAYDYSCNSSTFEKLKALTAGRKIIALSENGPIPDIQAEIEEEAVWSWWMIWYNTWGGNYVEKTSAQEWKKCMIDPRTVTLEQLHDGWNNYNAIAHPTLPIPPADIYTLSGLRTERPTHGINIIRGKKVFIP